MKELAKFFSGFFTADVLAHILMMLGGFIPFTAFGITLDLALWTITLIIALVLAIFLAYIGWIKK